MRFVAFVLVGVLAVVPYAVAQSKIGVLDGVLILTDSAPAKKANETLKRKNENAQKEVEKLEQPLETERRALLAQRAELSEEEFAKRERALREKIEAYQKRAIELKRDIDKENRRLRNEIAVATREASAEVAKERGLDMIVSKEATLYVVDGMDITADVLKRVNEKLK